MGHPRQRGAREAAETKRLTILSIVCLSDGSGSNPPSSDTKGIGCSLTAPSVRSEPTAAAVLALARISYWARLALAAATAAATASPLVSSDVGN